MFRKSLEVSVVASMMDSDSEDDDEDEHIIIMTMMDELFRVS
jgi:hypothetical protein